MRVFLLHRSNRVLLPAVVLLCLATGGRLSAQTAVDLNGWFVESFAAFGTFPEPDWQVAPDGRSVTQTQNSQPTLFCSDTPALCRVYEGHVAIALTDDDFIGVAAHFQPGDAGNAASLYYIADWKRQDQSYDFPDPSCTPGGTALAGLAAAQVVGVPTADEFWSHQDFDAPACSPLGEGVFEISRATTLGRSGWTGAEYLLRVEIDLGSLRVFVDDALELDVPTTASPDGRFCFYLYSQPAATFSDWTVGVLDCSMPVSFGGYAALQRAGAVEVTFTTLAEAETLGFEIRQRDDSGQECLAAPFLASRGSGSRYTFVDRSVPARAGRIASYRIVEITAAGQGRSATPWFPVTALTRSASVDRRSGDRDVETVPSRR